MCVIAVHTAIRTRDTPLVQTTDGHPCSDIRYITAGQHGQIMGRTRFIRGQDGQIMGRTRLIRGQDGQIMRRTFAETIPESILLQDKTG
jgi:hypothetical protein